MSIIESELKKRRIEIRMIGSKTSKEQESIEMIKSFIEE